jgi:hypothetical protein
MLRTPEEFAALYAAVAEQCRHADVNRTTAREVCLSARTTVEDTREQSARLRTARAARQAPPASRVAAVVVTAAQDAPHAPDAPAPVPLPARPVPSARTVPRRMAPAAATR